MALTKWFYLPLVMWVIGVLSMLAMILIPNSSDLDKSEDLKRMAEVAAAVAGITTHMPNEDAKRFTCVRVR